MPRYRKLLSILFLAAGLAFGQSGAGFAAGMNGPPNPLSTRPDATPAKEAPGVSRPLLGAIRLFQTYISPTDGARCQFAPTCSAFGHQAIHRHGPWLGLLMTTDRLMRCSPWTNPRDYPRRPDGRLLDPVATTPEGR